MVNTKNVAIILAGGSGKRMRCEVPKQYLKIQSKPIIYYTLKAFEESNIDEIVLVVGKEDIDNCRVNIIEKYNFHKVVHIVAGGSERYLSVYEGLSAIKEPDYVLIHDGARPMISSTLINEVIKEVVIHKACITAVPSKDTIKIVDTQGYVIDTPNRNTVWNVQTPQGFDFNMIYKAYQMLLENKMSGVYKNHANHKEYSLATITDDAMVLEATTDYPIYTVMGDYKNIKVTTEEDMILTNTYLSKN